MSEQLKCLDCGCVQFETHIITHEVVHELVNTVVMTCTDCRVNYGISNMCGLQRLFGNLLPIDAPLTAEQVREPVADLPADVRRPVIMPISEFIPDSMIILGFIAFILSWVLLPYPAYSDN